MRDPTSSGKNIACKFWFLNKLFIIAGIVYIFKQHYFTIIFWFSHYLRGLGNNCNFSTLSLSSRSLYLCLVFLLVCFPHGDFHPLRHKHIQYQIDRARTKTDAKRVTITYTILQSKTYNMTSFFGRFLIIDPRL